MMNTTLAMRISCALLGCLASCTSMSLGTSDPSGGPPPPSESKPVPDHYDGTTPLLLRGLTQPCGAVYDEFDGQNVYTYRFTYDAKGRPLRDIELDPKGALYDQIDYTWDNTGHLTATHDQLRDQLTVTTTRYDSLGQTVELQATVDANTTDAHTGADTRQTIDYAGFDSLGHPAQSTELDEDLDAQTSQTSTTTYGYDALGRTTRMETQGARHLLSQVTYDDDQRTSDWRIDVTPPPADNLNGSFRGSAIYDDSGRVLSTHLDNLDVNGAVVSTNDTVTTWDGDRELSEVITLRIASIPSAKIHIARTFEYQCDGATTH